MSCLLKDRGQEGLTTQWLELILISHPSTNEASSSPTEFERIAMLIADIYTHEWGKTSLCSLKPEGKKLNQISSYSKNWELYSLFGALGHLP